MYCLRVKILTLVTIGYIVGFIVGMYIEYCLWAQVAALDIYCIYWIVWDRYMQVLFLGRAPRTKETMPDFLKWRRLTRPPLVFRGLTGSQRTPGNWGVTSSHGSSSEMNCWTTLQGNSSENRPLKFLSQPFSFFFSCHALTPIVLGCPSAYEMHYAIFIQHMPIYQSCMY